MKGFGFTTILFVAVLILLLVSVILMALTMYKISQAKAFEFDSGDSSKLISDGVEAVEFWASYKLWMIIPTVSNVIGMALIALLYVMS